MIEKPLIELMVEERNELTTRLVQLQVEFEHALYLLRECFVWFDRMTSNEKIEKEIEAYLAKYEEEAEQ